MSDNIDTLLAGYAFTQEQKNLLSTAWKRAATNTKLRKLVDSYVLLAEIDINTQLQINNITSEIPKDRQKRQIKAVKDSAEDLLKSFNKLSREAFQKMDYTFKGKLYFLDNPNDKPLRESLKRALSTSSDYVGLHDANLFIRHLLLALTQCADRTIQDFTQTKKGEIKGLVWRLAISHQKHFGKKPSAYGNFREFCSLLAPMLGEEIEIGEDIVEEVINDLYPKTT